MTRDGVHSLVQRADFRKSCNLWLMMDVSHHIIID